MPDRTEWSVSDPRTLEIENSVTALEVRIVGGTVNVVGTADAGPARVEVGELSGPPLTIRREAGTLTVTYDDLPWKGSLKRISRAAWNRSAVVSVTVPAATRVAIGTVGASAVVSGISGRTELRGVSGDSTLVRLTGPVRAETVSGRVEGQAVTGDLSFQSISGDLTLVDGSGGTVKADSVSGDMVLDLDPAAEGAFVRLATVSGEVAIRLPAPGDTEVEANTTSGMVTNAFEDLRVSGRWGATRITGRLGSGSGTLKVTTVSGALALLRRPPSEERATGPHAEAGAARNGTGETPSPADKKVL
ncbi:hypothetical protein A6A06_02215 [Streptomyces sp. CB02923]|uniref:DUF4097 family beta strand repeat-containing protein n=1 Tax=Streptomyces sp. CB02923 TaxID=1718985 RepID=UPI00093E25ED|nr:DUF4097 family beta strand repeat-containing protein [Streptomyces sp. CB02923]OKI09520.1 hypothetical protein A6A06_02215 [Streptomyces sp. CB02923]